MVSILKREIAPLAAEAWKEIDEQVKRVLKEHLSARTIVDFNGPHGWELGAVNLGELAISKDELMEGITWGMRLVRPLIEIRSPFTVSMMEMDNISRGSKTANFDSLQKAAVQSAIFEDRLVYQGFEKTGMEGMIKKSSHRPLPLPGKGDDYPGAIADALEILRSKGIGGPYALVLGPEPFEILVRDTQKGYPLRRQIQQLIGGEILLSFALEGGLLTSLRGSDFELTVGQDFSVGYKSHTKDQVDLYITESAAFRVLEPLAAVSLEYRKTRK